MTKLDLQKFSKLELANARLDAALVRLEAALVAKEGSVSSQVSSRVLSKDIKSELIVTQAENTRLLAVNKDMSRRLLQTIRRIKNIAEEV